MPQGGLASHPTVTPRSHLPRRPDSLAHPADERETAQASSDGAKASVFPGTLDCGRALFGTHVSCLYNAARRPPGPLHAQPGSDRGLAGMPQGGLASHPTVIPQIIFPDAPTPRLIPRARGRPRRHPGTGPRLPRSPRPLDCWRASFGTHISCLYNAARRPLGPLHAEPDSTRGPAGMPQGGLPSHPTGIPQVIFADDPTPRLILRGERGTA